MLNPNAIALITAVTGRDVGKDLQVLTQVQTAVGQALNKEEQWFVSENLDKVYEFLYTEEGKIAAKTFVLDWFAFVDSKRKKPS